MALFPFTQKSRLIYVIFINIPFLIPLTLTILQSKKLWPTKDKKVNDFLWQLANWTRPNIVFLWHLEAIEL